MSNNNFNYKNPSIFIIALIFLGMIILLSQPVTAAGLADSPWPKAGHDNSNTGQSQYKGPQTNNTKWTYQTGDAILSSPVIGSDGTIYVGSDDNNLYALNPSGTLKWKYTTENDVKSSPAIGSDDTIYVGSDDYNLYALTPSGTLKWKYKTGGELESNPAIGSDGTIYLGSGDKNLYALNPTGTLKWKYNVGSTVWSPAIGSDGTVYIGSTDSKLYALNPSGTLKWKYTTGKAIWSSPAIGSDDTIYVGSDDYNLYALNPSGTLKWKYTTGGYFESSPAIGSYGTIYVKSDDNNLYAINPNGTLKWKFKDAGDCTHTPAIGSDGTIYIIGPWGAVNFDGYWSLYALNPNGSLKWTYSTPTTGVPGLTYSSPAIGADGALYFGRGNHIFYAFKDVKGTPPTVTGSDPANNAVNIPMNKVIKVTFSEPVKWGNWWIELKNSSGALIPISKSINGNLLTITPLASLAQNTKYTIGLHTGCVIDYDNNQLAGSTRSFTTIDAPPTVKSSDPANTAVNVPRNKQIKITFSELVLWGTFWIELKNSSGVVIPIIKSISGNVLNITPSTLLAPNTKYMICLHSGCVKDYSGNLLVGVVRSFISSNT